MQVHGLVRTSGFDQIANQNRFSYLELTSSTSSRISSWSYKKLNIIGSIATAVISFVGKSGAAQSSSYEQVASADVSSLLNSGEEVIQGTLATINVAGAQSNTSASANPYIIEIVGGGSYIKVRIFQYGALSKDTTVRVTVAFAFKKKTSS